jgi:hypothetical protein
MGNEGRRLGRAQAFGNGGFHAELLIPDSGFAKWRYKDESVPDDLIAPL